MNGSRNETLYGRPMCVITYMLRSKGGREGRLYGNLAKLIFLFFFCRGLCIVCMCFMFFLFPLGKRSCVFDVAAGGLVVLGVLEHQDGVVDLEGRAQLHAHDLHDVSLGQEQEGLAIDLLAGGGLGEEGRG